MSDFLLSDQNVSWGEALHSAAEHLRKKGVDEADTDSRLLLQKVTGCSGNEIYMNRDCGLTLAQKAEYVKMVSMRGRRIPLQHITGETWFYGRRFLTDENVLIPRMDTEILVQESLKYIRKGMKVLDMCTGSGCIAVTISKEAGICVSASDISRKALDIAGKNAQINGADCIFTESNMFENINGKYDMIVSNPPYIKTQDIETLQEEVREHDPLSALDGGADGLNFYRIIAEKGKQYLNEKGRLILEIGYDQAEQVSELLNVHGFGKIEIIKDLNNLDRVVSAVIG